MIMWSCAVMTLKNLFTGASRIITSDDVFERVLEIRHALREWITKG